MKRLLLFCFLLTTVSVSGKDVPKRPRILGIAHISLSVHDMDRSRVFYKDFLGYGEPFHLDKPDGTTAMIFIKINDRQYLELSPEKQAGTDRLVHIALETDNAEAMRAYLAFHGIPVPEKVGKGRVGNSNFMVKDPDGHLVEMVQYEPDGSTLRAQGKFLDGPRISTRIPHLGFTVGSLEPARKFYGDVLGFRETWRGSKDGKVLNWVNMKVPDGEDYLEFMLYDRMPGPAALGTMNHLCLEVPDVEKALADLEKRPARKEYTRTLEARTGINRKRQANLYDPDGTRSELMEPNTIDGHPTAPSPAPPPR